MARILADTGVLYALVDPSDQYHERARREAQAMAGDTLVLPYPILLEGYSLISRRLGTRAALRWLDEVRQGVGLINVTADDYSSALTRAARYQDQALSLFDMILAELSRRLNFPVWTFDAHFDILRVTVWRS